MTWEQQKEFGARIVDNKATSFMLVLKKYRVSKQTSSVATAWQLLTRLMIALKSTSREPSWIRKP